jgi:hypothetical protein
MHRVQRYRAVSISVAGMTCHGAYSQQSQSESIMKGTDMRDIPVSPAKQAVTFLPWTVVFQPFRAVWRWATCTDAIHFAAYQSNRAKNNSNTGLMSWPSLQAGLVARSKDEETLKSLVTAAKVAADSKNYLERSRVADQIAEVAYGRGISAQKRQAHLEKYGCAQYTTEALETIARVVADRGIVELGAGNGQWTKVLREAPYHLNIMAFDNMSRMPLTFVSKNWTAASEASTTTTTWNVMQGDERIFKGPLSAKLKGRVLLLIYPDPGPMAARSLENYVQSSVENDMVVYVGEGAHSMQHTFFRVSICFFFA